MKKKLNIEGMACSHCVNHVKNALDEMNEVKNVEVSLEGKFAVVEGENLDDSKMKVELEDAGYDLVSVEDM